MTSTDISTQVVTVWGVDWGEAKKEVLIILTQHTLLTSTRLGLLRCLSEISFSWLCTIQSRNRRVFFSTAADLRRRRSKKIKIAFFLCEFVFVLCCSFAALAMGNIVPNHRTKLVLHTKARREKRKQFFQNQFHFHWKTGSRAPSVHYANNWFCYCSHVCGLAAARKGAWKHNNFQLGSAKTDIDMESRR